MKTCIGEDQTELTLMTNFIVLLCARTAGSSEMLAQSPLSALHLRGCIDIAVRL